MPFIVRLSVQRVLYLQCRLEAAFFNWNTSEKEDDDDEVRKREKTIKTVQMSAQREQKKVEIEKKGSLEEALFGHLKGEKRNGERESLPWSKP